MSEKLEYILNLVPENNENIDWTKIEESFLKSTVDQFKSTHQRLDYHGEDDVWTHTKMVVDTLVNLPDYSKLDRKLQEALFLSALFHDLGKIYTTKKENGEWTSPFHASVGAEKFKELAKEQFNLESDNDLVELVSLLIANHIKPMHALKKKNPKYELEKIASNKEINSDFNLKLLSLLVEADMKGRISKDLNKSIRTINNFRDFAKKVDLYE